MAAKTHSTVAAIAVATLAGTMWWMLRRRADKALAAQRQASRQQFAAAAKKRNNVSSASEQHAVEAASTSSDPSKVGIVFASASGTAELFARVLAREAKMKGFNVTVFNTQDLPAPAIDALASSSTSASLNAAFVRLFGGCGTLLWIVATRGEGDATESGAPLLSALESLSKVLQGQKHDARAQLTSIKHALLGLGDSSYKHFARGGRRFDDALVSLGSQRILGFNTANAKGDLEGEFDEWQENIWGVLAEVANVSVNSQSANAIPTPDLTFNFRDDLTPATAPFPPKASALEPTQQAPFAATISLVRQMVHSELGRRTAEVVVDVTGSAIAYQAGDHLGVLHRNHRHTVARCLHLLGISDADAARTVELTTSLRENKRASPANTLPARVSLRDALAWYVDLSAAPRRSTVRMLARYSTSDAERAALRAACADTGSFSTFTKAHRTIVDVLDKHPTVRCIPVGHFMEVLPKIAPRYYSIASDSLISPNHIRVCTVESAGGLVTPWLTKEARAGDTMYVFVRHSNFQLPLTRKSAPIIMVGAGSGIAPYIGFLERREAWATKRKVELGPGILFFGCRGVAVDYLFAKELKHWKDTGIVTDVRVAFSRDSPTKVYVQHLVAEDAEQLWQLINEQKAIIYICGDARTMAKDVEDTLVRAVLMQAGGMSKAAATAFITTLEKSNRLLKDVWTS